MDNKYKEGSAVHAIANPGQKLIIRRYVDRIYYCKIADKLTAKELVFFEWELNLTKQNRFIYNTWRPV